MGPAREHRGEELAATTTIETVVRTARFEEYRAVARLLSRAHQELAMFLSPHSFSEHLEELTDVVARSGRGTLLVAEQSGQLVGSVTFHRSGRRAGGGWPRGIAGLSALGVDPTARMRGVGRRLLQECVARARAVQAAGLGAHTADFLYAANSLLATFGFRPQPMFDLEAPFENGAREPLFPHAYCLALR